MCTERAFRPPALPQISGCCSLLAPPPPLHTCHPPPALSSELWWRRCPVTVARQGLSCPDTREGGKGEKLTTARRLQHLPPHKAHCQANRLAGGQETPALLLAASAVSSPGADYVQGSLGAAPLPREKRGQTMHIRLGALEAPGMLPDSQPGGVSQSSRPPSLLPSHYLKEQRERKATRSL